MFVTCVLAAGGQPVLPSEASPPPGVWAEYDALKARTGRDADAEVRLAIWCEERGLIAQRHQHLARTVLIEPGNALARGLMGRVEYQGRWVAPESVPTARSDEEGQPALLAQYNARRDKLDAQAAVVNARIAAMEKTVKPAALAAYRTRHNAHPDLARERIRLGLWCEKVGLSAEAAVEFTTAARLDPRAGEAWNHLGYVRYHGRWVTKAQAEAECTKDFAEQEATDRWVPLLKKWRAWLEVSLR
jgi:hypothetical protein